MNWEQPSTEEEKKERPAAQAGSVLFMLLTIVVLLLYAAVFMNPQIFLNPFLHFFWRRLLLFLSFTAKWAEK